MRLTQAGGLSSAQQGELEAQLATLGLLEDVVRWGFAQVPRCDLKEVVIQDEYTHDVVLTWCDARFLVFDTT